MILSSTDIHWETGAVVDPCLEIICGCDQPAVLSSWQSWTEKICETTSQIQSENEKYPLVN